MCGVDRMKQLTPLKAIRHKCLDCCCNQYEEIKACSVVDCPLWFHRLGIRPFSDKNKLNPFFNRGLFEGLENKSAREVISIISKGDSND